MLIMDDSDAAADGDDAGGDAGDGQVMVMG